jgi:glycosyltransferase involved in cell wall biosynthesis
MSKISIIIPCYFNEGNIPVTGKELIDNEKLFPAGMEFEYVFVDDGSKDKTLSELLKFKEQYKEKVKIVKLASNVGAFNALLAGFSFATGDCNVILAADLQDPPELIPKMVDYWQKGVKLVIANRRDREESFVQKLFSGTYHALIRKLALRNVPPGGFDLVLFDRQLKEEVLKINEKNTNILYLLTWLGFDYVSIPYVRKKREIGKSRWSIGKKIKMFIDSFVAFSFFPIRLISITGLIMGFIAMGYGIFIIIARMFNYIEIEGWSSIMVVLLFVSSFQMIALGIIGEYVWRGLDASRNRPNYVVDKFYN